MSARDRQQTASKRCRRGDQSRRVGRIGRRPQDTEKIVRTALRRDGVRHRRDGPEPFLCQNFTQVIRGGPLLQKSRQGRWVAKCRNGRCHSVGKGDRLPAIAEAKWLRTGRGAQQHTTHARTRCQANEHMPDVFAAAAVCRQPKIPAPHRRRK